MESLYLLIPLSIALTFVIGVIFWWATRSGQFDDLEGPAHRILMDDDRTTKPSDTPHKPD
jgi:cbb3-type cytochrome oxidase maturation protein